MRAGKGGCVALIGRALSPYETAHVHLAAHMIQLGARAFPTVGVVALDEGTEKRGHWLLSYSVAFDGDGDTRGVRGGWLAGSDSDDGVLHEVLHDSGLNEAECWSGFMVRLRGGVVTLTAYPDSDGDSDIEEEEYGGADAAADADAKAAVKAASRAAIAAAPPDDPCL